MDDKWQEIQNLDLTSVKRKLKLQKGWFWQLFHDVTRIEKEYRQFLYLIAMNPGKTIVPWSEPLDEFWHTHVLDTRKYGDDCHRIFGQFIHHNPHLAVGTRDQSAAFQETKLLYKAAFTEKAQAIASKSQSSAVGCAGAMIPFVFCGAVSSSNGASCGSHCGSSCGSSCGGGGGCGGAGCGGGGS